VPHPWRTAEIVPIPKEGKDPTIRKSYRPISLTSVVCKTVERLIKNRVQDHLERKGLLAREQAGYRTARSVEEHCVRLSQVIHDGLQRGHHTVLLSVDATAAFDRMVKARLYAKMRQKGLPEPVISWFRAFLTDRKARVRVDGATSHYHTFEEGCPQGTVLGPLCWLLFVDDLRDRLRPVGGEVFLYADDVCIAFTGERLDAQYVRAQRALDLLRPWAQENGVQVSMDKTCATAFGPRPKEVIQEARKAKKEAKAAAKAGAAGGKEKPKSWGEAHYPGLTYAGTAVKYAAVVRFLGLMLDDEFTFEEHIAKVRDRQQDRMKILRCVSGTSWGCRRRTVRTLYLTLLQSVADFALAAYAPFVEEQALQPVREVEVKAAMHVGGTVARTRHTAVYGEANVHPITRRGRLASANMYERLMRLPPDNPGRVVAELPEPAPARPPRRPPGWRRTAKETVTAAGLDGLPRDPIPLHAAESVPARMAPEPYPSFCAQLVEPVTRKSPPELRRRAAEKTLATLPEPDVCVYTDGSVLEPGVARFGGGGYFLVDAAGKTHPGRCPAGRVCDSFRAEEHALLHALRAMAAPGEDLAIPRGAEIRMMTDSQSAVVALEKGPRAQTSRLGQQIWQELRRLTERHGAHVTLAYVPGHAGIEGNERADVEASAAAEEAKGAEDPTPIPLPLAKTCIRALGRRQRDAAIERDSHWWEATRGKKPRWPRGMTRGQERVIAQLRAGKCPVTAQYLHLIEAKGTTNNAHYKVGSPHCECGAVDSVRHLVLECPKYEVQRQRLLDEPGRERDLTILSRRPVRVMEFLREIRRDGCAAPKEPPAGEAQPPAPPATAPAARARTGPPKQNPKTHPKALAGAHGGTLSGVGRLH
jgi:ribonuclease HI